MRVASSTGPVVTKITFGLAAARVAMASPRSPPAAIGICSITATGAPMPYACAAA